MRSVKVLTAIFAIITCQASAQPTFSQQASPQPTFAQPTFSQQASAQPTSEQPTSARQASAQQASAQGSSTKQPSVQQPSVQQPSDQQPSAQQPSTRHPSPRQTAIDKQEILDIISTYSKSVIEKDSMTFYALFNDGTVTWCAALKDSSQARDVAKKGQAAAGSNYFSGSYKGFMRSLYRYNTTEDKFDNIQIVEDGTVASVMMDYSFWGNNKMTNWGNKYLTLIKRDGHWKITTVIYSLELTDYFPQPPLKQRKSSRLTHLG